MGDRTIFENKLHRKYIDNTADNPDMLKHLPHWLLFTVGVCALGLALVLSPNEAVSRGDNTRDFTTSLNMPGQSTDTKLVSLTFPVNSKAAPTANTLLASRGNETDADVPALSDLTKNPQITTTIETEASLTDDTAAIIVASINPNTALVETEIADIANDTVPGSARLSGTIDNTDSDISALIQPGTTQDSSLKSIKVKNGDNLALILARMGVSPRQVYDLVSVGEKTYPLTRLHPGDIINVNVDANGELKQLKYELDHERTLDVRKQLGAFDALIIYHDLERHVKSSTGTIQSSLFLAAKRAGLSTNLTMELASIFGWDIDFALNIRTGDRFTVLYEEIFREGKKIRDGNIIAAEFINRGKIHRAFRYTDSKNHTAYYTPAGRSLRSTFLRTPIEFARVSSKFNLKRKHPVLNRIRAHKGVDYAAPTGTAIRATANGKVTFRGTKGGYGKTVILQHGSKYTTLYAHLSNYKRGVTSGKTVKQGAIIGYVGKTGLATGPHLHYEFRVNGVHRNPLTVKLPSAAPIKKSYLADFQQSTQSLVAQLNELSETAVASVGN